MPTPIVLTLYDENDEPIQTYSRTIIPWGLFKRAMDLSQTMETATDETNPKQPTLLEKIKNALGIKSHSKSKELLAVELLELFVAELYGNKFDVKALKGADSGELMTVLRSVISRAGSVMNENPTTFPAPKRKAPRKR